MKQSMNHKALWSFISCLGAIVAQSAPTVWTASSLHRIWQDSPAGSSTIIEIYAARGETYSFQIGIKGYSTNVTATTKGLRGRSGVITGGDIAFYREQYIYIPAVPAWLYGGPNNPGGAGMYPDGLIPFVDDETGLPASAGPIVAQPFTVSATTNQVLWVDIHVPSTYVADKYNGTITISSDQGTRSVGVTLHVWNFALPTVPSFKSSVQAYMPANRNDRMARELLRNKQSPAWAISSRKLESEYIDRYGLTSVGNLVHGTGWYIRNCRDSTTPPAPEPSANTYQGAYAAHDPRLIIYSLIADQVYSDHGCDSTYPAIVKWSDHLHSAVPKFKTLLSIAPEPKASSLYGHIDIWTDYPTDYQLHPSDTQARIAAGDQVWLYNVQAAQGDNYTPKQNLNWSPLDWRLAMGFISANLGFSGWQQWAVDCFPISPWTDGTPAGCSSPLYPGDGFSMYPGAPVGIMGYAPSMRIKWGRDAIDDNEYVHILKQLGYETWAKHQIDPIAHDFANWTHDYTQVEAVRIALGNKIHQLIGDGGPRSAATTSSQSVQSLRRRPAGVRGYPH